MKSVYPFQVLVENPEQCTYAGKKFAEFDFSFSCKYLTTSGQFNTEYFFQPIYLIVNMNHKTIEWNHAHDTAEEWGKKITFGELNRELNKLMKPKKQHPAAKNLVIKYVRDKKNNPIGCVIALLSNKGEIKYSFSLCHKSDLKFFSKKDAVLRAKQRLSDDPLFTFPQKIKNDLEFVQIKAKKYFKQANINQHQPPSDMGFHC